MADPSKAADDAIYNDDASGYAYDQYQTENQWLYDDNQAPVKPDSDAQQLQQQQQPQPQYSELPITSMGGGGMGASNNDTSYTASDNKDAGKLFVGGLSWETDENRLREYFSKFGPIMDCSIMRDQVSGRPRGFGFVTFVDVASVDAVLQEPSHRLDGKHIDPKHAIPREQQPGAHHAHPHNGNLGGNNDTFADPIGEMRGEKIFVGGLPPSATDADLNSTFSVYGTITETKLMIDRETGRSRGYGFLQFENESSALESVKVGNSVGGIMIHGKRVDVKPAVHKKRNPMPGMVQGGYNMMGYNMMGYNMMGMPGYNMMGMPGYNMMPGANGQQPMSPQHQSQQSASATAVSPGGTGAMDYTAMGYPGYYGNMAGYYDGADGGNPADQTAMMNYYAQMGGYYPTEGQADGQTDAAAANNGQTDYQDSNQYDPAVKQESKSRGDRGSRSDRGRDRGRDKESDRGKDRGRERDHRSSSRRHGERRSSKERSDRGDRGDRSDRNDRGRADRGGRSGGDSRGQRPSKHERDRDRDRDRDGDRSRNRDRDGPVRGSGNGGSSRGHGYKPY